MLNKVLFLLALTLGFNSINANAEIDPTDIKDQVTVIAHLVQIKKPFVSLGIVTLDIKNKTKFDILIKSITSPEAHHAGIYSKYKNEAGANNVKRQKDVFIRAESTTEFAKGDLMVLLTGLKRKYTNFEEIEVTIDFENIGKVTTYIPVDAKYD